MSLLRHHTLNLFLDKQPLKKTRPCWLSLENLTSKQCQKLKSSVVDSNNHLNSLFSLFNNLHKELLSGFQLVDNFSDWFFFHIVNYKDKGTINTYIHNLDKIYVDSCLDPKIVIIISNVSIKNRIATSISYVHYSYNIYTKKIHHAINVTFTKVELFTIRYGINQAIQVENATYIIVITDAIHAARQIFDSFFHPYQLYSIVILQNLRAFFSKKSNNFIVFWDFPSSIKWIHHLLSIKRLNSSTVILFLYINCYETLVRKKNTIQLFKIGKWYFKHWITRETISSIFSIMTIFLLSSLIQKVVLGLNFLDTPILCVQEQWEQSLIMFQ